MACEFDHISVVRLLIARKADPNLIGGSELRAINIAAGKGNLEIVQLLIENGADVDPEEEYWYGSAVGLAARLVVADAESVFSKSLNVCFRRGHADVVKLLLAKGWSKQKTMKTYGSFLTCAA